MVQSHFNQHNVSKTLKLLDTSLKHTARLLYFIGNPLYQLIYRTYQFLTRLSIKIKVSSKEQVPIIKDKAIKNINSLLNYLLQVFRSRKTKLQILSKQYDQNLQRIDNLLENFSRKSHLFQKRFDVHYKKYTKQKTFALRFATKKIRIIEKDLNKIANKTQKNLLNYKIILDVRLRKQLKLSLKQIHKIKRSSRHNWVRIYSKYKPRVSKALLTLLSTTKRIKLRPNISLKGLTDRFPKAIYPLCNTACPKREVLNK